MIWIIEIERVGPGGFITRYVDTRGRVERFPTREAAQAVAEHLEAQASVSEHGWTRYEVMAMPEPPYRAERAETNGTWRQKR